MVAMDRVTDRASLRELERRYDVHRAHWRRAIERGELGAIRPGMRTVLVDVREAERWLERRRVGAAAR